MQDNDYLGNPIQASRWLSLPTGNARKITLLMLIPVVLAYVARILVHQWLEYERVPFGTLWWIICTIACFVGAFLLALILGLTIVSVRRAQNVAPAVVLLGGIMLSFFLPFPPLPIPVFPEETFFIAHRAEFETAVSLARQDKLSCLPNVGCDAAARKLPLDYVQLSSIGFVQVSNTPPASLTMKFWPLNPYYPIVYFERTEDRNLFWYAECRNSRWVRKLDEHWYLCAENDS